MNEIISEALTLKMDTRVSPQAAALTKPRTILGIVHPLLPVYYVAQVLHHQSHDSKLPLFHFPTPLFAILFRKVLSLAQINCASTDKTNFGDDNSTPHQPTVMETKNKLKIYCPSTKLTVHKQSMATQPSSPPPHFPHLLKIFL